MPNLIDIPSDQFVTLDGVRFHYLDWGGDGDPLLLLAGLGCTAHVFAELAPHLSDGFRVLRTIARERRQVTRARAGLGVPRPVVRTVNGHVLRHTSSVTAPYVAQPTESLRHEADNQ